MKTKRKNPNPNWRANLRTPTHEEAVEMQKKAMESYREKKARRESMKKTLDILLLKSLKRGEKVEADDILSLADAEGLNIDVQTAINLAMIQRAMLGDVQAASFIRDTIGEKPSDKVEVDQSLTIETWAKNHKVKL